MRRLVPHPLLSASLFVLWLLLVNTVTPGQVALAAAFALAVPAFTRPFWPEAQPVRRPFLLARLLLRLVLDILIANLVVARLILGPMRRLNPAFVRYPLTLENEYAITILASVITLTPGTVSADVTPDRRALVVHTLNLGDEEELIRQIRSRYEMPLKEIFE